VVFDIGLGSALCLPSTGFVSGICSGLENLICVALIRISGVVVLYTRATSAIELQGYEEKSRERVVSQVEQSPQVDS
jgi:hypothetical protein